MSPTHNLTCGVDGRTGKKNGFNPFRAPEPLPILCPSNFVPKNGFPVVKGLRNESEYFFFFSSSGGWGKIKL